MSLIWPLISLGFTSILSKAMLCFKVLDLLNVHGDDLRDFLTKHGYLPSSFDHQPPSAGQERSIWVFSEHSLQRSVALPPKFDKALVTGKLIGMDAASNSFSNFVPAQKENPPGSSLNDSNQAICKAP